MQLSLFGVNSSGDVSLERDTSFKKPDLQQKYQKMLEELDDYQRAIVLAHSGESMSCIAGPGCLAGDSVVRLNRAGKSHKFTLKEAYLKFNGKHNYSGKKWDLSIPTKIRSFMGNCIQLNEIQGIYYSGIKKTYRLTLENGVFVDLTEDHLVLTKDREWVPAGTLNSSDEIMVDTLVRHKKTSSGVFDPKKQYRCLRVGEFYAHKSRHLKRGKLLFRAPEHRLIIEAEMNGLSLKDFISATYFPNTLILLSKDIHVHHEDGNSKNNTRSNLHVMSKEDHGRYHTKNYLGFKHVLPEYSKFKSFEFLKEQNTYDIECRGPSNFVANGIVVHNSGKTKTIISRAIKMVVEDKVDPTQIVLITFTNKAARELKERYHKFFEDQYPPDTEFPTPHISTIHSFCLHQIRRTFGFPRTILSEYHSHKIFKEVAREIILKKDGIVPDLALLNRLYKIQQSLQASMEILYAVVPLFNIDGTLAQVLPWEEAKPLHPNPSLLRKLPYTRLLQILNRESKPISPLNTKEIVSSYIITTPIRYETWVEILKKFLEEKYKNKSLDFSDMDFQYLLLMAQFPELRERVHRRISHVSMDEMQDSSCNQFLAGIFSDKESFEEFNKVVW